MKKIFTFFTTISVLFAVSIFTSNAQDADSQTGKLAVFFEGFSNCPPAQAVLIISIVLIVLAAVFGKKLSKRLDNTTASQMANVFIAFFSVFGLACFFMSAATDGETWKHLINGTDTPDNDYSHFSDYIQTLQNTGTKNFSSSADRFSPFSLSIFYILAQFMPADMISSTSYTVYLSILKNQTFVFLYLILVLFCVFFIYKTARTALRCNELKFRNELIAFLLVVSYPSMYCISMGNITGIAIALCLFFLEFKDSENKLLREMSIIAIAVSAAIVPYTFVFAFLYLKDKSKMSKLNFAQSVVFFLILFIVPASFTGTDSMITYLKSLLLIGENYVPGNSSLINILRLTGMGNAALYFFTAIFEIASFVCIFILPKSWQKSAAAVCCILNLLPNVNSLTTLFVFIPLVYLLSEKTHKAIDWLYLLAFSLLITPFPEWFRSYSEEFTAMLDSIGATGIMNANEVIAPFATQMILVLSICQAISVIKKKKREKVIEQVTI